MTPVFFLSDGYLANGAEPWPIPKLDELPRIVRRLRHEPPTAATNGKPTSSCPTSATSVWCGSGPSPARQGWSIASAASRNRT